ncbi:MAG: 1-(5-phosphoribosyl)-5-[(5-phosphoribosylamino)methylideneamino]imidazole-4-carboxamide isomerase [Chloroflexi bacterium]|nr:1-(5-phosphoribosyl)-5-[(5-phosphoribosylamino)methylideneamino]imidazole-4-carboxamide isomerase [Chloroflexota bacterium]
MEVVPAIDLRGGRVVRLHQGDYEKETAYSSDPVGVALGFQRAGAPRIHVVDLDGAAAGRPANLEVVRSIVAAVELPVQVGGGLRRMDAVARVLEAGARRAILGTVAVEEPSLVREAVARYGAAIVVGVDAREGVVAVRGWLRESSLMATELIRNMASLGVRRFVYTDIARDGTLTGPNIQATAEAVRAAGETGAAVIASGGVASVEHLQRLREAGVEGAIVGMAIYSGKLDLAEAIAAVA